MLVYPNVIAVERQLRVKPADFRLWVCLHEVTHRVQFRANPWLAEHMSSSLAVLTKDGGEQVGDVVGRLGAYVRAQRSGKAGRTQTRRACSVYCAPYRPNRSARRWTACWCSAPCWRDTPST